ncbi:MAG: hypothetical protein HS102_07630 [Planctomycetia bacterium]|nr:hypothetical protein [Planctomycetia bacterium]
MTTAGKASKPLKISGDHDIAAAEKLLRIIGGCSTDVLLARKLGRWRLGGQAALMQALMTWARFNPGASSVTHVQLNEDPTVQLTNLLRKPHAFVGLLMANDIVDLSGRRSLRKLCYELATAHILRLNDVFNRTGEGEKVFLASVDHLNAPPIFHFYHPDGSVRSRNDFRTFTERLLPRVVNNFALRSHIVPFLDSIALIIYELFHNTDSFARTDIYHSPLRRSIRLLIAEFHNIERSAAHSIAEDSPPLKAFMDATGASDGNARLRFIELSILDSGPGLARHRRQTDSLSTLSIDDEFLACQQCLTLRRDNPRPGHLGRGLHEVVNTLTRLRGFLRLRTGRLSLYRDFALQPYRHEEAPFVSLTDWSDMTPTGRAHPMAEGVLYTLLIPLPSDAIQP